MKLGDNKGVKQFVRIPPLQKILLFSIIKTKWEEQDFFHPSVHSQVKCDWTKNKK